MAYTPSVRFVETSVFTRRLLAVLDDGDYLRLQMYLIEHPEAGVVIRGTHALRKLRWAASGRGRRGGLRVIYRWMRSEGTFEMLFIYRKSEQSDLTAEQMRALRAMTGGAR
jgi:mRNA-degrading endonuclease RelE of RelBE toxin-antitoxin system